jgi:hypothetical protein
MNDSHFEMTARELSWIRQNAHPNGTERFYADRYEEDRIGCAGELVFADIYGLEVDLAPRPCGDEGLDFTLQDGTTIDVKTARKPYYLLVKCASRDKCADVLVLGKYFSDDIVEFLGWEIRDTLLACPRRDIGRKGIVSHYLAAERLIPMNWLDWIRHPLTYAGAEEIPF